MSAASRKGYDLRISSRVAPANNRPRTDETVVERPLEQKLRAVQRHHRSRSNGSRSGPGGARRTAQCWPGRTPGSCRNCTRSSGRELDLDFVEGLRLGHPVQNRAGGPPGCGMKSSSVGRLEASGPGPGHAVPGDLGVAVSDDMKFAADHAQFEFEAWRISVRRSDPARCWSSRNERRSAAAQ